jgi:hypothetical protein
MTALIWLRMKFRKITQCTAFAMVLSGIGGACTPHVQPTLIERRLITAEIFKNLRARITRDAPSSLTCIGIRLKGPDTATLRTQLTDPEPEVSASLRQEFTDIRPISRCRFVDDHQQLGPVVQESGTERPSIALWISEFQNPAKIRAGYYAHGLASGEWICSATRDNSAWVVECDLQWVS